MTEIQAFINVGIPGTTLTVFERYKRKKMFFRPKKLKIFMIFYAGSATPRLDSTLSQYRLPLRC